ncbi:DNA cytosine methyltransferase [Streptomyces sp. NBC_00654]|uniref:DNA cytosine methyltransferase n=1 Tax=Streptomyces sp. NBC_00654 TaxID=2975799 RepID=UPI0022560458|nr:DNA cytosine methyltransferase [Streptomyces sp. NBC_00654]MCX4969367.1 DNA cytosine methyltransferase [Streptomyces sp. NBC_00654]MCX4971146.1 DNA cytosine methyltransferase [Streptomyces sp. NBC_00654]
MIVEGFGGPGGWAVALKRRGARHVGMETDRDACATRAAAGHPTIRCDVTAYPTAPFRDRITGKVDSPVCTPYSRAGKGLGKVDQPVVAQAIDDLAHGRDTRAALRAECADKLSILAAEPMRWHHDLRPEWIVMEQVPDVLPLWQQYVEVLTRWGYSASARVLNAADYGVPQTRRRAVLAASRIREVVWPEPTHYDPARGDWLWGTPWVSMAEALGLPPGVVVNTRGDRPKDERGRAAGGNEFPADGPSNALTGRARSWKLRSGQVWKSRPDQPVERYERAISAPAFTITGSAISCKWVGDGIEERNLSLAEAATLQTFPAGHPFHGTRTSQFRQVGNAIPPLLAEVVFEAAAGPVVDRDGSELRVEVAV